MSFLKSFAQVPDVVTVRLVPVPVTVTVQLRPPRLEVSVPLAVLCLASIVRRALSRPAAVL
jgi:hypothetical protein